MPSSLPSPGSACAVLFEDHCHSRRHEITIHSMLQESFLSAISPLTPETLPAGSVPAPDLFPAWFLCLDPSQPFPHPNSSSIPCKPCSSAIPAIHFRTSEGGMDPERMGRSTWVWREFAPSCAQCCSRISFELFKGSSPQMKKGFLVRSKPVIFLSQIKSAMTQAPIKVSGRILGL